MANPCQRACLEGWVNNYLEAMKAHNVDPALFAREVKFTENGIHLPLGGEGLWFDMTGIGNYKFYVPVQPVSERPAEDFKAAQPDTRLDLGRILKARQEISRMFRDTPQFECPGLRDPLGCELVIKLETANPIGCSRVVGPRSWRRVSQKARVQGRGLRQRRQSRASARL